ncbi:hypothetical protein PM082_023714 [Marasmius tenuissimus]|nr:hypothetical protein PM082_023714 [Marasmius tenuissimus]
MKRSRLGPLYPLHPNSNWAIWHPETKKCYQYVPTHSWLKQTPSSHLHRCPERTSTSVYGSGYYDLSRLGNQLVPQDNVMVIFKEEKRNTDSTVVHYPQAVADANGTFIVETTTKTNQNCSRPYSDQIKLIRHGRNILEHHSGLVESRGYYAQFWLVIGFET